MYLVIVGLVIGKLVTQWIRQNITKQALIRNQNMKGKNMIWFQDLRKSFKWRWTPMEDDLYILKVEYLINRLLDHTQILNLDFWRQKQSV